MPRQTNVKIRAQYAGKIREAEKDRRRARLANRKKDRRRPVAA